MDIIKLENVSYIYGADTPFEKKALDSINLTVKKGSITGIIGHTGSGKSTLVQILVGLLKPCGTYYFDSHNVWENEKKPQGVKFNVGLVMQYPEYQLFDETVYEDIAYAPKNMGLSDEEIHQRVREAAIYTGLSVEILNKSPFELSGGQKRRAAIAGVLAMRPSVLVLDEPAAGLDPRGREEILGGLRSYRDRIGATVIIVSHSMEDMAKYCDDIIVLKDGRVSFTGTSAEVFSDSSRLVECGLNVPQITEICKKLKEKGLDLDQTVLNVEDAARIIKELFDKKRRGKDA